MRAMIVTGFIVADAEVKQSTNGNDFLSLRLVNHEFDAKAEDKRDTFWVRVTSTNHVNLAKYLTKGRFISVIGRYSDSVWNRKDGTAEISRDIFATDISFERTGSKSQTDKQGVSAAPQVTQTTKAATTAYVDPLPPGGDDDELPF